MLVVSEYSKILSCCLITIRYYFLVSYSIWGKVWGGGGVLSRVQLFVTPWTVALQAPLSMEFSRQEYWSGLSLPIPGYLLNPGIKPAFLSSPALTGGFFITSATSTEIPPHKQIIPLRRAKKKKCFTRQSSHFRRMKMKQWNSERLWLAHSGKVTKLKQNQMLKQCFSYK